MNATVGIMKKTITLLILACVVLSGCANYRAPWEKNPYVRSPSTNHYGSRTQRVEPPIHNLPKEIPQLIEQPKVKKPINTEKPKQTDREVKQVKRKVTPSTKTAALKTKNEATDSNALSAPATPKKVTIPID